MTQNFNFHIGVGVIENKLYAALLGEGVDIF